MGLQFENAHCHTMLSNALIGFPDSPASIEDYAQVYKERDMHCLCMSEHSNRGDVWKQADIAAQYTANGYNMKPICAAEVYFVPDRHEKDDRNFHLLLLAKNNEGFKQLNLAISKANIDGYYYHGRVDFDLLSELNPKNFIVTTACIGGILKDEEGERYACQLAEMFGEGFHLEVQHHVNDKQIAHNMKVIELYKKYGWPLFFGCDSHYVNKEDKILREELQLSKNIHMDDSEWDLYLPTADEAYKMFKAQKVLNGVQIEEAFENTLKLREFEGFSYDTERKLPVSKLRQNMTHEERKVLYQKMVCDGYISKAGMPNKEEAKELRDEMNTILSTDSEDYFISLKDMLDRGVELGGVLTTTARGSAGSFATNYALDFTTINRLKAPVTFYAERFISADKLKAGNPDIDSNLTNVEAFEQAGKEMFGEYGCLPMIAYMQNKTSSAFKMLARARKLDFDTSNTVSKQLQTYELDKKHAIDNNSDNPDYDADEEIDIKDYVNEKYWSLIDDSKKYQGIIMNISPHPCAHLTYHKDLREEIGTIKIKDKLCVFIDGVTADKLNYVKSDLLRVDVVKIISDTFKAANKKVMSVDELLDAIKSDNEVWSLYENGFTQGLNQCEKPASTQKIMQFKPRNISELSYFVAAIRPGFKSNIQTFISRERFNYGIPALDKLLKLENATGETGESSYLIYDENVLRCLKFAGIPGPEAYATIKNIKKKHKDKVLEVKEKFKTGFVKYLVETEHADENLANETTERAWKVIEDSASYLFCGSHAFAMACDSAYGAYLKAHFPYEFYVTMLKLYTEKKNKEKVTLIIDEMARYRNIHLTPGRFGQDNRDWFVDKENKTISQSLSSIKFMNKTVTKELYEAGKIQFDTFTDVLFYLSRNTHIDTRQLKILIGIGYFSQFGKTGKLMKIFNEFTSGINKVSKTIKNYQPRLDNIKFIEETMEDVDIKVFERLCFENDNVGLCLSKEREKSGYYFVTEVDDKYGCKIKLYNVARGTMTPYIKINKKLFAIRPIKVNDLIFIKPQDINERQRYSYTDGERRKIEGAKDWWMDNYDIKERISNE